MKNKKNILGVCICVCMLAHMNKCIGQQEMLHLIERKIKGHVTLYTTEMYFQCIFQLNHE